MNRQDLAVLIISCDKFADTWAPCVRQFRKFFPEGFKIYVGSNLAPCKEPGVTPVLSGPDADWSTSLKRILQQIPERKVFVIVEDYFLATPVDAAGFEAALSFLFEKDAKHIKYYGIPAPDAPTENPKIGIYHRGAPYRATVCGFWDREYLTGLLLEGENPWNFEIVGSSRTAYSDGFYGLVSPLCTFRNMIEKGSWLPRSVEWARAEGIALQLEKRPMLKGKNQLISRAQMGYFGLMLMVPWRWRVALMNKLRKVLISY